MNPQHSKARPYDLSYSTTIKFQLVGRTTLSEHLPNDSIDVPFKTILCSPHLLSLVKQHASTLQANTSIEVPNIDPAGFRLYLEYLHTARITYPFRASSSISHGLLLCDSIDLIYAHIVGARLGDADFQDYIIDEIGQRLDPAQTPDSKVLEVVFVDKGASSVLKRFVTDKMFAMDRRMLEMLKGHVKDAVEHEDQKGECEYHVHVKGECYKTAGMQQTVSSKQSEREMAVWNADEDLEFKAIAAHYLDSANGRPTTQNILIAESSSLRIGANGTSRCPSLSARTTYLDQHSGRSGINMHASDPHYFGSAAWSRDLHNTRTQTCPSMSSVRRDKPLPEIPHPRIPYPDSCGVSPVQPSPQSLFALDLNHSSHSSTPEPAGSVQDLIAECLARTSSPHRQVSTQDLVTDCLSRLSKTEKQSDLLLDEDTNSLGSKTTPSSHPSQFQKTLPASLIPGFSYSPSPPPRNLSPNSNRPNATPSPPHSLPDPSPPRTLPSLITRKPAPSRGLDWIEQWERLDALRGTQGFGLRTDARVGRKTKFRELLGG